MNQNKFETGGNLLKGGLATKRLEFKDRHASSISICKTYMEFRFLIFGLETIFATYKKLITDLINQLGK